MRTKIILLLLFSTSVWAQKMVTLNYFKNDSISLDLDLYLPRKKMDSIPLVLFVHGGGFSGGDRAAGKEFCSYLAQNGYAAASISYTLYMKGRKFSCDGILTEKVKAFRIAASELWRATAYMIGEKDRYHIDVSKIFISGSSAGGETVLHAAYWDFKRMNLFPDTVLPDGFRYAGLISGAGAIMDLNLVTKQNLLPMYLFHGNGDHTVPYANAAHHYCPTDSSGWLMLFGSYSLYQRALELDGSISLDTFCGGGHEYSGYLFEKEPAPLLEFLQEVRQGKKVQRHVITPTGKSNELSAAYSFCP